MSLNKPELIDWYHDVRVQQIMFTFLIWDENKDVEEYSAPGYIKLSNRSTEALEDLNKNKMLPNVSLSVFMRLMWMFSFSFLGVQAPKIKDPIVSSWTLLKAIKPFVCFWLHSASWLSFIVKVVTSILPLKLQQQAKVGLCLFHHSGPDGYDCLRVNRTVMDTILNSFLSFIFRRWSPSRVWGSVRKENQPFKQHHWTYTLTPMGQFRKTVPVRR